MEPVRIEDDMRDEANDYARSSGHKRDDRNAATHTHRFNHIQQGLGTINEERNQLMERTKKVEKEKKLVQKQLELREREILTLVKRCASQEEKLRESGKLRSDNRDLQHRLDSTRRRLDDLGGEYEDVHSLKKKLQQSELDREHLQDRLAKLQREHDSIADTLQECLANIRQLTEEKHQIEEERRRERRRAELELEKQRLDHVNDSNNLKEEVQMHQTRVLQMEKILQDNMYTNTALRREKAIMSQGQNAEVQEVVQRYERQLVDLRSQIDQTAKSKEDKYNQELSRLKEDIENAVKEKDSMLQKVMSDDHTLDFEKEMQLLKEKLDARDSLIEGLETEFSEQMEELMSKQSSLDEVEEERKVLEDKVDSMRNLETEHAALLDFVQILDSNLAEITSENAHMILEKDTLQEEVDGLRKTAEVLQLQIESYQQNRKARESDFRDLLHAEKEELRTELEESLRLSREKAASLQSELDCRNEWIEELEGELKDSRRQIIEKEDEITEIKNEMEVLRSNLTFALQKARIEVSTLESEVFVHDQTLASIEGRLDSAKASLKGAVDDAAEEREPCDKQSIHVINVEKIHESRREMISGLNNAASSDVPPEDLQQHLRVKEEEFTQAKAELESQLQDVRNEAMLLQKQIESLSEEKSALAEEVEASRSHINERDDQIVALQQSFLQYKKREKELQRRLGSAMKEGDLTSDSISVSTPTKSPFWSLDEGPQALCTPTAQKLQEELDDSRRMVLDRENRVKELEQELIEAQRLHSSSSQQLQDARDQASDIEKKMIGDLTDAKNEALETRLVEARSKLSECEASAERVEAEYEANVAFQNEQKDRSEETASQIVTLEQRIEELDQKNVELEQHIKEREERISSQNESIVSLRKEAVQSEDYQSSLLYQLENKCAQAEALQSELASKREELNEIKSKMALKTDAAEIKAGLELKVGELEGKVQILLTSQTELATELEKASNALDEERMQGASKDVEDHVASLKMQLVEVRGDLTDREISIKKLQLSLEKNEELHKGLEGTMDEAQKTIALLEDQKRELNEKCIALEQDIAETRDTLNQKVEDLETKNIKILACLHESESIVSTLREQEKDRTEEVSILESHLADAREEIQELEQEVKIRGDRIMSLEKEINDLDKGDIEVAFMESEKRRSHLEGELTKANRKFDNLSNELEARERRLLEIDTELEMARTDISQKDSDIHSKEKKCKQLEKKIQSLDNVLESREERLMEVDNEIESIRRGTEEGSERVQELELSNRSLKEALELANAELVQHKSLVDTLESAVDKYKGDVERVSLENVTHEKRISSLEQALQTEIDTRISLESDVAASAEAKSQTVHQNEELQRKIEEKTQALSIAHDELSETKRCLAKYVPSSPSAPSGLEKQVTELTTQLALRDDEIRELRLVELKDAEETIASLTEEINTLTEDALQKNLEITTEKAEFSLQQNLSATEQREMEICEERDLLQSVEEAAQQEVENLKQEVEAAIKREKEMADIKIRNKEAMHKEEMDDTLSALQSTTLKLKESETILKERSTLLGEMVDQNKELESQLEKEQDDLKSMEGKFAQGRVDLEQSKKDLKEIQHELRRKESVLQSKLKEERESKEFAEESLRKLKIKYNQAVKTQKCVTDLERQNSELRDKIRRQEAYLQRKLDREKMERGRLTPTKGIIGASPAKSVSSRTPTQRSGHRSAPPSAFAVPPRASKLQAPLSARSKKRNERTPVGKSSIPKTTDRSITSELSSLLRTPTQSKEQRNDSSSPTVPTNDDGNVVDAAQNLPWWAAASFSDDKPDDALSTDPIENAQRLLWGASSGIAPVDAAWRLAVSNMAQHFLREYPYLEEAYDDDDEKYSPPPPPPTVLLEGSNNTGKTWMLLSLAARFVVATRPSLLLSEERSTLETAATAAASTANDGTGDETAQPPQHEPPMVFPEVIFMDSDYDFSISKLTHIIRSTLMRESSRRQQRERKEKAAKTTAALKSGGATAAHKENQSNTTGTAITAPTNTTEDPILAAGQAAERQRLQLEKDVDDCLSRIHVVQVDDGTTGWVPVLEVLRHELAKRQSTMAATQ
ncbi:MAG: hypothetical protein SGILL_001851, partial [Bacillariaceae sp.]